jgi:hypothetical protein
MDCSDIEVLPQYSSTCWLNALLMSLFYSQGCRAIIKAALRSTEIDRIVSSICTKFCLPFYNKDPRKPEHLLKRLAEIDPYSFSTNPTVVSNPSLPTPQDTTGGDSIYAIRGLLEHIYKKPFPIIAGYVPKAHLNNRPIKYTLYDTPLNYNLYNPYLIDPLGKNRKKSLYSCDNINKMRPELVVIVAANTGGAMPFYDRIPYNSTFEPYGNDKITTIKGVRYVLSSMTFLNFNNCQIQKGHMISGITCNDAHYVYNGWTIDTLDPAIVRHLKTSQRSKYKPCKLFPYDWMASDDDFCIANNVCELPLATTDDLQNRVCFNTKLGRFLYFLVREDLYNEKECPQGSIVSRISGKCIKEIVQSAKPKAKIECPPGKVISPISGKCIIDRSVAPVKK